MVYKENQWLSEMRSDGEKLIKQISLKKDRDVYLILSLQANHLQFIIQYTIMLVEQGIRIPFHINNSLRGVHYKIQVLQHPTSYALLAKQ